MYMKSKDFHKAIKYFQEVIEDKEDLQMLSNLFKSRRLEHGVYLQNLVGEVDRRCSDETSRIFEEFCEEWKKMITHLSEGNEFYFSMDLTFDQHFG